MKPQKGKHTGHIALCKYGICYLYYILDLRNNGETDMIDWLINWWTETRWREWRKLSNFFDLNYFNSSKIFARFSRRHCRPRSREKGQVFDGLWQTRFVFKVNKVKVISRDTVNPPVCLCSMCVCVTPPQQISPFGWAPTSFSSCSITLCLVWELDSSQWQRSHDQRAIRRRRTLDTSDTNKEQWSLFCYEARATCTLVNLHVCQLNAADMSFWPLAILTLDTV